MHPLVTLAANAPPGDRRYVCFVGAGLSKDAGLPTAWDLMLATAKLLRANDEPEPSELDLQTWFLNSPYKDLTYGELVGRAYESQQAQQNFMRGALRADEPGRAHRLLAKLAKEGVIRCIITTNFDDLIERACGELASPFEVVTEENLKTTGPLIQCNVLRIYKPHGTLGASRLRNTPKDLEKIHGRMERELGQVINDHGLILLGYAAADPGIHLVFKRKRRTLYPTFWVNLNEPSDEVQAVFGHEKLHFLPCTGAAAFLDDLLGMHRKLSLMIPKEGVGVAARAAQEAIREGRKDAKAKIRAYWERLAKELEGLAPNLDTNQPDDDEYVKAIDETAPLCAQFAEVAIAAADMEDQPSAIALTKGFEHLLPHLELPDGVGGMPRNFEFDFYQFLGHELFVCLFAPFVQARLWRDVAWMLREELSTTESITGRLRPKPYHVFGRRVGILKHRSERLKLRTQTLHADLLKERHSQGGLGDMVPFESFMAGDCLLFLASREKRGNVRGFRFRWAPVSLAHQLHVPRFLAESELKEAAGNLCVVFGVMEFEELRLIGESARYYKGEGTDYQHAPLYAFDHEAIGTRG